ncbi:MAG: UvrD-helicase domain-containing protein, partial [Armatimonadota bacterium]
EMKERLARELEPQRPGVGAEIEASYIGTIDSFCSRILREHAPRIGLDPEFEVLDEPAFVLPTGATLDIAREVTAGLNEFRDDTVRLNFERFTRHRVMDYYARLRIAGCEWVDARCLPTFVHHFRPSPGGRLTSNVADVYWSVNMVRMGVKPSWDAERAQLRVTLQHCMPFFHHYEARIDAGRWEERPECFDWPLHEGINRLECRAVNVMRRPGIVSSIEVAYARPRW